MAINASLMYTIEFMRVEPSGVVMFGICSAQTAACVARQQAPITAVWTVPGRTQIDVCSACLDRNIEDGIWDVEGARHAAAR